MVRVMVQAAHPPTRLIYSPKVLIYGPPGSGKTTLGGTWFRAIRRAEEGVDVPSPLLVLNQDSGADIFPNVNQRLLAIDTDQELLQLVDLIVAAVRAADGPPYTIQFAGLNWSFSGLMIDTINALQSQIKPGIFARHGKNGLRAFGEMKTIMKEKVLLRLGRLGEEKPFGLIVTCQTSAKDISIVETGELNGDEAREAVVHQAALDGSLKGEMSMFFDIVLTTRVNPGTGIYEVYTRPTSTLTGVVDGKLRFGAWIKGGNPGMIRNASYASLMAMYGLDVFNPDDIAPFGEVDLPHWALLTSNQIQLERVLTTSYGSTLKEFFAFCGVPHGDWDALAEKEADLSAKELVGRFAQHKKETAEPEAEAEAVTEEGEGEEADA